MAKKKSSCSTSDCDNEVYCLDMCRQCYQAARYWKAKSMKEIVNRGKKLRVYENRLDALMPKNVKRMPRRKKAS